MSTINRLLTKRDKHAHDGYRKEVLLLSFTAASTLHVHLYLSLEFSHRPLIYTVSRNGI